MKNSINDSVELNAPISYVWSVLVEYNKFGEWFGVKLDKPFMVGQISCGQLTYPGYEHIPWEVSVQAIIPEQLFAFTWHPYAVHPEIDYSKETPTRVEFKLKNIPEGVLLSVSEMGFENLPEHRQMEAYQMNSNGWAQQMKNIQQYINQKR